MESPHDGPVASMHVYVSCVCMQVSEYVCEHEYVFIPGGYTINAGMPSKGSTLGLSPLSYLCTVSMYV